MAAKVLELMVVMSVDCALAAMHSVDQLWLVEAQPPVKDDGFLEIRNTREEQ